MLRDGRAIPEDELLETDLCIIGAGPAGISIAREFIGKGLRVCLLESGGQRPIRAAQRLNDGRSVGYWYYPLASTRARAFGGSSALWWQWQETDEGGRSYIWRSGPLDPVDFESRPGIAHTGWPFSREALIPFYERAQKICQLGPFEYGVEDWEDPEARPRWPLPRDEFVTNIFQYGSRTFADYLGELARAQNVTTILNSTVCELVTAENPSTISEVTVRAEAGKAFRVKARAYVLAAGGIENARLLLLCNKTHTAGLGNTNDLVGRFFMERLTIRSGVIAPTDSDLFQRSLLYKIQFARGVHSQGVLRLNEKLMRSEGLLNAVMFMLPAHKAFTSEGVRSLVALYRAVRRRPLPGDLLRHAKNVAGDLDDVALTLYRQVIARGSANDEVFILRVQAEQSPNPSSRVTLDDARDAFGLRKARLDWRVTEFDRWSIRRTQEILDRELRRANLGRLERKLGEEDPPALFRGAFHHMGTTRMHREASHGVVDADCRVHGLANLFVAGSSVFPTAGSANPTLTLVALAVRLADHLKDELAAG
jgi:choline dehydrogenase-like flavoprotein